MALFKTAKKAEPQTFQTVLQKMVEKAKEEWLKNYARGQRGTSLEERVTAQVKTLLTEAFNKMVYSSLGIEVRYGEVNVRYDSPLRAEIKEITNKILPLVRDFLNKRHEEVFSKDLPSEVKKAALSEYEAGYLKGLKEAAEKLGEVQAEKDLSTWLDAASVQEAKENVKKQLTKKRRSVE